MVTIKKKSLKFFYLKKNLGMFLKLKIRMCGKIFYKIHKFFSLWIVHQMFSFFCEFYYTSQEGPSDLNHLKFILHAPYWIHIFESF
jgi:hypothetical protein